VHHSQSRISLSRAKRPVFHDLPEPNRVVHKDDRAALANKTRVEANGEREYIHSAAMPHDRKYPLSISPPILLAPSLSRQIKIEFPSICIRGELELSLQIIAICLFIFIHLHVQIRSCCCVFGLRFCIE